MLPLTPNPTLDRRLPLCRSWLASAGMGSDVRKRASRLLPTLVLDGPG